MKVLSIVGARPQFIKAAVVSKRIREHGGQERLLHTGQHYDFNMSEVFFRELDLPEPSHYLGIGSGPHGQQTARMLAAIEDVLLQERPDAVIIYGDTNTTLAGALAPVKLHVPVAHVEAGLRSDNRRMPEEINRIVADHCADVLFCPTETAVRNLEKEGFTNVVHGGKLIAEELTSVGRMPAAPFVVNVGDVMLDIARQVQPRLGADPDRVQHVLAGRGLKRHEYVLATIHRASNTDDPAPLRDILAAMQEIGRRGLKVFFPAHPRTKKALDRLGLLNGVDARVLAISEPVSYMEMIALESQARVILTDSGGVQKEAYFLGVPCVVARDETEWSELVDAGWNRLAGAQTARIVSAVEATLSEDFTNKERIAFYGDGHASSRIASLLTRWA